jgi:hypothetical protein
MTNVSEIILLVNWRLADLTKLVEGVKERIKFEEASSSSKASSVAALRLPPSSRRRKGMSTILFFSRIHW